MKRYSSLIERRKNPELNPYSGAWEFLEKYKSDPDVYITFTEIDKVGLNPNSKYNTPIGIYTYPLREYASMYISKNDPKSKYYYTIGSFAPFAGDNKFVNFLKVTSNNFIHDMYSDYGSNNFDRDIKILEKKYGKNDFLFSYDYGTDSFDAFWDNFISKALKDSKAKNPIMSMWNITRLLSLYLTNNNNKAASTKWNLILNKDLGYDGFADKSKRGYIHPSEPMQAVFLSTKAFKVLGRFENKPSKPVVNVPKDVFKKGTVLLFDKGSGYEVKYKVKGTRKTSSETYVILEDPFYNRPIEYTIDDLNTKFLNKQIEIVK